MGKQIRGRGVLLGVKCLGGSTVSPWIIRICSGTGLGMICSLEVAVKYPSIKAAGAPSGLGAGPFCRAWRYPARNEAIAEWNRNRASPGCEVWVVTVGVTVGLVWVSFGVGLDRLGVGVGVDLDALGAGFGCGWAGDAILIVIGACALDCVVASFPISFLEVSGFAKGRVDRTAPVLRYIVWCPSSGLKIPLCVFVTLLRHWGHWFLSASQVAMQVLQNLCSQCNVHKSLSWMYS